MFKVEWKAPPAYLQKMQKSTLLLLATGLLAVIIALPVSQSLKAEVTFRSDFTGRVSTQDESLKTKLRDAKMEANLQVWQREQGRLERDFEGLRNDLQNYAAATTLKEYDDLLAKLSACKEGDWECTEEVRWEIDDLILEAEKQPHFKGAFSENQLFN